MLSPLAKELLERFRIVEGLGDIANDQAAELVRQRLTRAAPAVVADLEADQWDYDATTSVRPNPPAAYVAGIIYRSMREAAGPLPGVFVDQIRDRHMQNVMTEIGASLTPETPHVEAVKLVQEALVNSLF
jgi:hypothetical protein